MELSHQNKLILAREKNNIVYRLFSALRFSLSQCCLCHNKPDIHPMLCETCLQDLTLFSDKHLQGDLLRWPAVNKIFPQRKFDSLVCLAPYVWPLDTWLKKLKYQRDFKYVDLLAYLLTEKCQASIDNLADYHVMSVPMHMTKWQERGFNQAHLIAKVFANKAQLTYLPKFLTRVTSSSSQVGKSGVLRRHALKHAFEITEHKPVIPEKVILLDDVITTGSTVNSICRILKAKGVKHITVLTVSLSLPKT